MFLLIHLPNESKTDTYTFFRCASKSNISSLLFLLASGLFTYRLLEILIYEIFQKVTNKKLIYWIRFYRLHITLRVEQTRFELIVFLSLPFYQPLRKCKLRLPAPSVSLITFSIYFSSTE